MDDLISRQAAIDALHMHLMYRMGTDSNKKRLDDWINGLPSAQETHEERTETHACDLISRQAAIDALKAAYWDKNIQSAKDDPCVVDAMTDWAIRQVKALPSAQPELIRCKDCIYGYLYMDVQNGVTDSWIECRNPDGLNRDVSVDGYCYASIRRM